MGGEREGKGKGKEREGEKKGRYSVSGRDCLLFI